MRRQYDRYLTPGWMVRALLKYGPVSFRDYAPNTFRIFEPCVGQGDIVRALIAAGWTDGMTNDIDPRIKASSHFDAAAPWPADQHRRYDWIVSNPPWAMPKGQPPLPVNITKEAFRHARVAVSMLLRITFLEPCKNRGLWLHKHPPDQIIVLPRYSFTGDGKSDSATACWLTWLESPTGFDRPRIVIAEDAERL
jgi:hypothetical protein